MKRIQSKKHKLGIYEIDKISWSCFDDKRYVLDDGIHTLAYFHKDGVTDCDKKDSDKEDWKRLWWLKKIGIKKIMLKKIVIIEKDCNDRKELWWLKKIVIKRIHACNKTDFSSNVKWGCPHSSVHVSTPILTWTMLLGLA